MSWAIRSCPGPGEPESQASTSTTARKNGTRTRRDIDRCSGEDVAGALSQGSPTSGKKTAGAPRAGIWPGDLRLAPSRHEVAPGASRHPARRRLCGTLLDLAMSAATVLVVDDD